MMVYEPLIAFDDAMKIVPRLAERWSVGRRRRDLDVPPAAGRALPRRRAARCRGRAPQLRARARPGGQPQAAVALQHDRPRRGRRPADRAHRHQVPVRRLRADHRARVVGHRQPGRGRRPRQGVRQLPPRRVGHGPLPRRQLEEGSGDRARAVRRLLGRQRRRPARSSTGRFPRRRRACWRSRAATSTSSAAFRPPTSRGSRPAPTSPCTSCPASARSSSAST